MSGMLQSENQSTLTRDRRRQARQILASILNLEGGTSLQGGQRPRDDEDFYLLGGNSLSATTALERLRAEGFNASFELFYETGNIGLILNHLCESESEKPSELCHSHSDIENTVGMHHELNITKDCVVVNEWNASSGGISGANQHTYDDILKLLLTEFQRTDRVTKALSVDHVQLDRAFRTYFPERNSGIVLTATYRPTPNAQLFGINSATLVGVILATPSPCVPDLPDHPQCARLQHYLECCSRVNGKQHSETTYRELSALLVAARAPIADEAMLEFDSVRGCWGRMNLQILMLLERALIQIAKDRQYDVLDAINTSEATMEVCRDLGYVTLKTTRMQEYAEEEHLNVDPKFYNHKGYYMIKYLHQ